MSEILSALVVDDETAVRELLWEALTKRGYEVRSASHGSEGIDMFRQQRCDLILLDVSLPDMRVLEALRHFRALDTHAAIILVTTFAERLDRSDVEHLGALFLHKPFNMGVLNALLQLIEESHARRLAAKGADLNAPRLVGVEGSAADRRRHLRARVNLFATVAPTTSADGMPPEQRVSTPSAADTGFRPCRILDISISGGGLHFEIDEVFPPGTAIIITFPTLPLEEPFALGATIVWVNHEVGQCGARFHSLDEKQTLILENIVVDALESS